MGNHQENSTGRAAMIDALLTQSKSTDIPVLLKAVEDAKKLVSEDPSNANLAALQRAKKMLEDAQVVITKNENLKSIAAVLAYIKDSGHKIGQTKLYEDINEHGLIKRQKDGTFKERDVRRYMASLPTLGTVDGVAEKAAERKKRKDEEEIRRIKAVADKEEFDLAVKKGKFIAKEQVNVELAGRAVTLASGIKSSIEARCTELIHIVQGNPKKAAAFMEFFEQILDERFNEYSQEMVFDVEFVEE